MKSFIKTSTTLAALLAVSHVALAAATPEEIDKLGKSLTLSGAERTGNAEGTIPAYTGGLPADTTVPGWVKGSGRYERNPFDDEKPVFTIKAADIEKYKDKLTAGSIQLLKKYPDYRMDIYKTHRSVAWREKSLSYCKKNAANAKLTADGNGFTDAYGCVPFPIPKNGLEAQWNHQLRQTAGYNAKFRASAFMVDASGRATDSGHTEVTVVRPYQNPETDKMVDAFGQKDVSEYVGPPASVGIKILQFYSTDFGSTPDSTWSYSPGQRRTRIAPEFSYDTPISSYGGAVNFDELFGFKGKPDRFNWKLVGKKEIYVPYNANRLMFAPTDKLTASKDFVNPDLTRWELHRVWVVEQTLKEGQRHVFARRTMYIDEDSWATLAADAYDQAGKLYRIAYFPLMPVWDHQTVWTSMQFYDQSKGTYFNGNLFSRPGDYFKVDATPAGLKSNLQSMTPEAMSARGIR
ncbi:DUF1329 domain-containing protein [Noviherbaspirillum sedimenti]|uniref:DUF1329 domain-containing protein n=1 Tax=Noviherbaspirillum sedimenti TaxID=2320865 RepID=A0A3A3G0C5_9BURK|nr:DUF1329 domain-containing protein [Noviherbaspirillum sedimenti]RJG01371.1 DUF1329 domain-containing protein [Noviherbaspirillum sedimenti]